MLDQMGLLSEGFAACLAPEWFFAGMSSEYNCLQLSMSCGSYEAIGRDEREKKNEKN